MGDVPSKIGDGVKNAVSTIGKGISGAGEGITKLATGIAAKAFPNAGVGQSLEYSEEVLNQKRLIENYDAQDYIVPPVYERKEFLAAAAISAGILFWPKKN